MKKTQQQIQQWRVAWLKAEAANGPTGLALLAELLNWSPDRIKPTRFKQLDTRRRVLEQVGRETERRGIDLGEQINWRDELRSIQAGLRRDLLSILQPTQLSEEEFRYWRSYERWSRPPVAENQNPRINRLCILTTRLALFQWKSTISPGTLARFPTSIRRRIPTTFLPNSRWSPLHGEQPTIRGIFQIDGEELEVEEQMPRFRDIREELYFIVYLALRNGDVSRLRICKNRLCGKVFLLKRNRTGDSCSNRCRSAVHNQESKCTGKSQDRYKTTKVTALERAQNYFRSLVENNSNRKSFDSINSEIDAAKQRVLNGKHAPTGGKKEFKKFVEDFREKALERIM